jgi:hypothetical protein
MANEVLDKFDASTAFTITLASLASSAAGVGRQATIVDNTTNRYTKIELSIKLKQGTNPTGSKKAMVYLIKVDNHATAHRSDGAGATDAAFTVLNAPLIGVMRNKAAPSTGDLLYGEFTIHNPGPKWGIAIVHDTGVNLDSTEANHWARWVGSNPEIQD